MNLNQPTVSSSLLTTIPEIGSSPSSSSVLLPSSVQPPQTSNAIVTTNAPLNSNPNTIPPPLVLVGPIPQAWDTEFFHWCIKNGVRCPKLSFPVYFGPQGIRGFLATEDINSYDDLLVVPSSLIISKTSCYCSAELGHIYSENYRLFEDDEDAAVATYICYHRAIQKDKSFWWPYLRILPDIDVLADWNDQELLALQDSYLVDLALERRAEYAVISTTFTSLLSLKYPDVFPRDKFTPEWFTWAYKQVTARGFGSRLPEVLMVPLADCFNHGNVATKYTFEEHATVQYRSLEGVNSIQSLRVNTLPSSSSFSSSVSSSSGINNSMTHSPTSSTSSRTQSMDPVTNPSGHPVESFSGSSGSAAAISDRHTETVSPVSNDSGSINNGLDPSSTSFIDSIKNMNTPSSTTTVDNSTNSSLLQPINNNLSAPVTETGATVPSNPVPTTVTMEQTNHNTNITDNTQRLPNNQHILMMKQHVSLMKEGIFRMFPTRNTVYKANEPVYFSYGRRDNIHLAMEYGFTLLDNEHDMVVLYPGSNIDYGKLFIPPRARTIIDFAKISTGPFKLKWRSLDPNMLTLFRAISVGLDDTAYADFEAGRVVIFNRLMSGPMETAALQRLHAYLYSVLKGMGTSIEEDEMLLNSRDILPARLLTAVRYRLTRKHLIHSHILLTEERVLKLVKKSSSSSLKAVIAASNNVLASVNGVDVQSNMVNNSNKVTPVRSAQGIHNSPINPVNGFMDNNNGQFVNNINNNIGPNMFNVPNNNNNPEFLMMNNPPLPNSSPMLPPTNNGNNNMMRKGPVNHNSPMAPMQMGGTPMLGNTTMMNNNNNNNNRNDMGSRMYNEQSVSMNPSYPNTNNIGGNSFINGNNNSYPNNNMMVPSSSSSLSNNASFSMNNIGNNNQMLPGMMNNNNHMNSIPNNSSSLNGIFNNSSGNLMVTPNNNNSGNNLVVDMLAVPPMPPIPPPLPQPHANLGHQSIMIPGVTGNNFPSNNGMNSNANGVFNSSMVNMNQYSMNNNNNNQYKNR